MLKPVSYELVFPATFWTKSSWMENVEGQPLVGVNAIHGGVAYLGCFGTVIVLNIYKQCIEIEHVTWGINRNHSQLTCSIYKLSVPTEPITYLQDAKAHLLFSVFVNTTGKFGSGFS